MPKRIPKVIVDAERYRRAPLMLAVGSKTLECEKLAQTGGTDTDEDQKRQPTPYASQINEEWERFLGQVLGSKLRSTVSAIESCAPVIGYAENVWILHFGIMVTSKSQNGQLASHLC